MDTLPGSTRPIFTDESGRRAVALQWFARCFVAGCAVLAGAVVFTLTTHVPLPGLDRILSPRTGQDAARATGDSGSTGRSSLGAGLTAGTPDPALTAPEAASNRVAVVRDVRASETSTAATAGAARAPEAAPVSGTSPATPQATGTPNPHATSTKAASPNPHATAKAGNSSKRATPKATKTANPRAVAARTKPKPSGRPTATPAPPTN
jgi:hypothetical protein